MKERKEKSGEVLDIRIIESGNEYQKQLLFESAVLRRRQAALRCIAAQLGVNFAGLRVREAPCAAGAEWRSPPDASGRLPGLESGGASGSRGIKPRTAGPQYACDAGIGCCVPGGRGRQALT